MHLRFWNQNKNHNKSSYLHDDNDFSGKNTCFQPTCNVNWHDAFTTIKYTLILYVVVLYIYAKHIHILFEINRFYNEEKWLLKYLIIMLGKHNVFLCNSYDYYARVYYVNTILILNSTLYDLFNLKYTY